MTNRVTVGAILILFALRPSAAAQSQTITGKVVAVGAGDAPFKM